MYIYPPKVPGPHIGSCLSYRPFISWCGTPCPVVHRRVSFETYLRRQLEPAGSMFTAVPPAHDAGHAWYGLHVVQAIKNIMDIGIAAGIDQPGLLECVVRY